MRHAGREYSDDESSFHGSAHRSAVNVPEIISNRSGDSLSRLYPTHMRGAPQVFGAVGHGAVVSARQIVVRDGIRIDLVVVSLFSTYPTRGRVTDHLPSRHQSCRPGVPSAEG